MSEDPAMRAYAASAEALKQNMLAHLAHLLALEFDETVVEDDTQPYCVRVQPSHGRSIPFMNVSMKPFRKRGPGSATEVLVRAVERLAKTRVWSRHGTIAPPFGLMKVNAIGKGVIERSDVDPQSFLDATWTPVDMDEKYADTADWMSNGPAPDLLDRSPAAQHPVRLMPPGLPWMSGWSNADGVYLEAVALSDDVVIYRRPTWGDEFEVRIRPGLPLTTINALIGGPLRRLIKHPLLNRFDLRIKRVSHHQRSLRFTVGGSGPWTNQRFKGGNDHRRELAEAVKVMQPGRRHLEDVIRRMLTVPGCRGDFTPQFAMDFDLGIEDGYDAFMGKEIEDPEFEGITTRRLREQRGYVDDDPIIQFDEDDRTSYS